MQRRTAVAAASAISISLVSAAIYGATTIGALGFAAPSNPPASPAPVVTVSAQPAAVASSPAPTSSHEREAEHERTSPAPRTTNEGRRHDD